MGKQGVGLYFINKSIFVAERGVLVGVIVIKLLYQYIAGKPA
jgi:hypothetical protein